MPNVGDVKVTLQSSTGQKKGWFYLNGQTITADATAAANATLLFGSATLPNYNDKYLRQSDNVGEISGSNQRMLTQQNLPKVHYTGMVLKARDQGCLAATGPFRGYASSGDSSGTGGQATTVYSIDFDLELNPSATQASIDLRPLSVGVKYMVYLNTSL